MANNKQCISRLQKEYKTLLREPVPHISAHPTPTNLLEWHFVLEGDKETDYGGGLYHGKIVFPPQYPFKPPSLSLYTPNGRFATNTKLCLSMTDYHPESWNPMWSVGTILTGLLSFMHDNLPTTGSITSTSQDKKHLAADSLTYNMKNPMFRKLFPEWVEEATTRLQGGGAPGAIAAEAGGGVAADDGQLQAAGAPGTGVPANGVGPLQGAAQAAAAQHQPTTRQVDRRAGGPPDAGVTPGLWTVVVAVVVLALAAAPLISWGGGIRHSPT